MAIGDIATKANAAVGEATLPLVSIVAVVSVLAVLAAVPLLRENVSWDGGPVRYLGLSNDVDSLKSLSVHLIGSYGRLTQEGARMVAPRKILLMALSSLGLTGCAASLQDLHYAAVNKTRAEYSWYSKTSLSDRWNCGSDYAYGYKSGYYDAATGKACTLPAVPPPCYWSTKYQCCDGQKQIQDWYRGYQCGVAAAQGTGYPSFHDVPIGPQAPVINKDGCGACYAPTGCLCEDAVGTVAPPPPPMHTDLPAIPHLSSSQAAPTVDAQPIYPASAVSELGLIQDQPTLGLIGPAGPAELKSKLGMERTRTASATAPVGQVMQR